MKSVILILLAVCTFATAYSQMDQPMVQLVAVSAKQVNKLNKFYKDKTVIEYRKKGNLVMQMHCPAYSTSQDTSVRIVFFEHRGAYDIQCNTLTLHMRNGIWCTVGEFIDKTYVPGVVKKTISYLKKKS